jgi:4-hydroxy-3-polyprenylbenzoate decarboxylase
LIVGISGASGVVYGIRLLEVLRDVEDVATHLVMTNAAKRTAVLETDYSIEDIEALPDEIHRVGDVAASISSGSFRTMGMVIVPCSMKTLSGVASSYSDNLLLRAADVVLKERRKLVLALRETPLHLGHVGLMKQAIEMGAIVAPLIPAFYHRPKTLDDIINQTVNRILDLVDIALPKDLFRRWQGPDEG